MKTSLRGLLVLVMAGLIAGGPGGCQKKKPPARQPSTAPQAAPAAPPAEEAPPPPPPLMFDSLGDPSAAIKALRAGGFVLAIRHTKTDVGVLDTQGTNFEDCTKQRNLSAEGRQQAERMGALFIEARIPFGEVYSSPFCRNKETARIIFGRATLDAAIIGDTPEAVATLKVLLATAPAAGKNTVIISHQKAMTAVTGQELFLFNEGATLVMKPGENGTSEIVATIQPDDWAALAEAGKNLP